MVWWEPNHFSVAIQWPWVYNAYRSLDGNWNFLVANKSRSLTHAQHHIMHIMATKGNKNKHGPILGLWDVWIHYKTHIFFIFCILFLMCEDFMMHPPSSLMDLTASPKVRTMEGKGVGARSLACSTLGVEGCVRILGWD
jgi:hypothetical protein